MNIILFISFTLFAVGGMFSLQYRLQMLQQNSYFPKRYFKWLKSSLNYNTVYSAVLFIMCTTLLAVNATHFLPFIAVTECIVRIIKCVNSQQTSIKKLVYTKRVVRLIVTSGLINIALLVLSAFFVKLNLYFAVVLFAHFPSLLLFVSYFINSPMEKAINNKFIREAKKILKNHKNLLVIGVTGSFGKTSVKFILNRILSEKFNVVCTPESYNTPMGIVKTVREKLETKTEIFIAEMGAKNRFDIKELCDICNPFIGLISAVGPQHLETFKTMENIAKTKFELAEHCFCNSGKVYVNFNSSPAKEYCEKTYSDKNIISVGTNENNICRAENIKSTINGTEFDVIYKEHRFTLKCKLLGYHSITNILLATAAALDLGVSEKQIRFAVASLKATPHRLELKSFINGALLIDDAYNSNPEGSKEALRVLSSFEGMRRVVVTPGLVELGDREYECNYALGSYATECCDDIILVGPKRAIPINDAVSKTNFDKKRVFIANSFKDAMKYLNTFADRNTVVLFENDLPDNYAG